MPPRKRGPQVPKPVINCLLNPDDNTRYLEALPQEVKMEVFSFCQVKELCNLAETSHSLREAVAQYFKQNYSKRLLIPSQPFTHGRRMLGRPAFQKRTREYYDMGILFKRCTLLWEMTERVQLLKECFFVTMCVKDCNCRHPRGCMALHCLAAFTQGVTCEWTWSNKYMLFTTFFATASMTEKFNYFLSAPPGIRPLQEVELRSFVRRAFLDPIANNEQRFQLLSFMLTPYRAERRARLFYLLYGVADDENVMWNLATEQGLEKLQQLSPLFVEMAVFLDHMHRCCCGWTLQDAQELFEALTMVPAPWPPNNKANLLLICGNSVVYETLKNVYCDADATCLLLSALCEVGRRTGRPQTFFLHCVDAALGARKTLEEKRDFIEKLINAFKVVLHSKIFGGEKDAFRFTLDLIEFVQSLLLKIFLPAKTKQKTT